MVTLLINITPMSTNLFVAGKSGNPNGRPKHSVKSPRGMIERFVKRNITPTTLNKMYQQLSPPQQADFITQLLPYFIAKVPAEGMSREEVDKLYEMITKQQQNAI